MSFGYWQTHQERPKSQAEQRAADVSMGEMAADLARAGQALLRLPRSLWRAVVRGLGGGRSRRRTGAALGVAKLPSKVQRTRSSTGLSAIGPGDGRSSPSR